jgi:hypothetical protein
MPFIGVAPCRQYDSRSVAPLADNTNLAVALTGAPCGLPASAQAVSVDITVFDITGAGGNGVFRVGTANDPTTAWINYPSTETQRGNAGAVPLNGSGQIVVKVNQGGGSVDFTVDVNGYYSDGALGALASGERFTLVGDVSGTATGLLVVHNTESASGARAGYFVADSSGFGSTGIGAVETASIGLTAGVYGQANSSTSKTAGVSGVAASTTGRVYGIYGQSDSTDFGTAGVFGVDGSGNPSLAQGNEFAKAGVRGASKQGQGVLGYSETVAVAGYLLDSAGNVLASGALGQCCAAGVFYHGGLAGDGTKSFVEPHPTDPSRIIRYVSLEGPEAGTYFRGRGRFQRGLATIEPPEDFRMVTDPESLSIQVTPIGEMANVAVVSIGLDGIVVRGSRDVEFFYLVNGVRRAYNNWDPIQENDRFFVPESPAARLPAYLSEEEKARLVANGTYKPDGTVNMDTAERLGWTKMWADREAQAKAAASHATSNASRESERR